jgi:hypothetical protein
MARTACILTGLIIVFGSAGATFADTACLVNEVCEQCTENTDDTGVKLRLFEQHCKDQADARGYEFLSYRPGPVSSCEFIRTFTSDISCEALGLKPAADPRLKK